MKTILCSINGLRYADDFSTEHFEFNYEDEPFLKSILKIKTLEDYKVIKKKYNSKSFKEYNVFSYVVNYGILEDNRFLRIFVIDLLRGQNFILEDLLCLNEQVYLMFLKIKNQPKNINELISFIDLFAKYLPLKYIFILFAYANNSYFNYIMARKNAIFLKKSLKNNFYNKKIIV